MFKNIAIILLMYTLNNHLVYAQEEQKEPTESTEVTPQSTETTPESVENSTENTAPATKFISRSSINIVPPIDIQEQSEQDLVHYLPNEQLVPMLAGPNDFLTLFGPSLSSNDKGVAIILPEWQQAPTNPKAINFLRTQLPIQGWNTITILSAKKPLAYPSHKEKLAERQAENKLTLEQYQRQLAAIMQVVMNKAQEYPGIIILISQGNNSAQLQAILEQENTIKPNAFIILSGYMLTDNENKQFAEEMSFSSVATLDIFLSKDNKLVKTNAILRKQLADRELKVLYRQQKINNINVGYYPNEVLLRQINGWLRAIGW